MTIERGDLIIQVNLGSDPVQVDPIGELLLVTHQGLTSTCLPAWSGRLVELGGPI